MIPLTANWKAYNALAAKRRVTTVSFSSYPRVFTTQVESSYAGQYPWIISLNGGGISSDSMSGFAKRGQMTVCVADIAGLLSADFQSAILDGQTATIQTGFVGMAPADFATIATMQVEKVDVAECGNAYDIVLRDLGIELDNPVYQYGDDGWPVSDNHQKTVQLGPMALIEDVLVNQVGYSSSRLNSTAMAWYTNNLFFNMTLQFFLKNAPQAEEFLSTELFKALWGFGFWNYAGQFTPHFHAAVNPVLALDLWDGVNAPPSGFLSGLGAAIQSPLPVEQAGDYYTDVQYRLDYDGQTYTSCIDSAFGTAEPFDLSREFVIQAKGLRSPLGGALYTRLVSWVLFQRYGLRPVTLPCEIDWTAIALEPGDLVPVSHPLIKKRPTGAAVSTGSGIGLSYELFHVDKIAPNWENGTVRLDMTDVNYLNNGPWEIAPDGAGVWTSGGAATKNIYIASASTGEYSDGTPGRPLYP
jgi:hypothetical protein